MLSMLSKILSIAFAVTNIAFAVEKVDANSSANKQALSWKVMNAEAVHAPTSKPNSAANLNGNALILDNSHFDEKQLLNPNIRGSRNLQMFGPGSGGGGNICGLAIQRATADILRYFKEIPDANAPSYLEAFKQAITQVKFLAGSNLMLRGQRVNAINYPDQKVIVLDEYECGLLANEDTDGRILLLHEYLGLAKVDDANYQISSNIGSDLTRIRASQKKTNIFQVIPGTTVGQYALAWGIIGSALDSDRYALDESYRDWVHTQYLAVYLVDLTKSKVLSIVAQQSSDEPGVLSPGWGISLISDGKNGLLILQHCRWNSEFGDAFFTNQDGSVDKVDPSIIRDLNQKLNTMLADHVSKARRQDILNMMADIPEDHLKGKNGFITIPVRYYSHKPSEDNEDEEFYILMHLKFDYSDPYHREGIKVIKTERVSLEVFDRLTSP